MQGDLIRDEGKEKEREKKEEERWVALGEGEGSTLIIRTDAAGAGAVSYGWIGDPGQAHKSTCLSFLRALAIARCAVRLLRLHLTSKQLAKDGASSASRTRRVRFRKAKPQVAHTP